MYWVSKYDQHRNLSSSKLTSRNPTNSNKWTPSNLEQPQIAHFESNPQGVRVSSHKPQCLSDIQTRSNLPIESKLSSNGALRFPESKLSLCHWNLCHTAWSGADGNMKMIWKSVRNLKRKIATAVIVLHHNAQDEQQVRLWDLRSPETSHWQTVLGSTS